VRLARCVVLLVMLAFYGGWALCEEEFPSATSVLSSAAILDPVLLKKMEPVKFDAVEWGGAIYPADLNTKKPQQIQEKISLAHSLGIKYIGSINGAGFSFRNFDSEVMRDFDGSARHRADSREKIFKCFLRPKMFDGFVETAKRCVDVDMDGFILDDWFVDAKLCFCDRCAPLYRKILMTHGDDPMLQKLLLEVVPDTFDFAQYLRDKGIDPNTPDWRRPYGGVFMRYRNELLLKQKRRFWQTIREYADSKGKRDFLLTANVYRMNWRSFTIDDLLDYYLIEMPYLGVYKGYPPRCASIALLKKTRMVGKRGALQLANVDTVRKLIEKPSFATLLKIWIAETYASGNVFYIPPRSHGGIGLNVDEETKYTDFPMVELKPYLAFVQKHPEIYEGTVSPAKVGVVYFMSGEVDDEYTAVCKVLYDAHYQFDAVFIGDGKWNKRFPTAKQLAKYDVLVMPLAKTAPPKEAVRELSKFAKAGGKLVLCSTFPNYFARVQDAAYRPLWKAATGSEEVPQEIISFLPYLNERDEKLRDRLVQLLGTDPILTTNAPPTVGIQCWRAGDKIVVHLINYDYIEAEDAVKDVENIEIHLSLHAKKGKIISPDTDKVIRVRLRRKAGSGVKFTVPRLHIHCVAVLTK